MRLIVSLIAAAGLAACSPAEAPAPEASPDAAPAAPASPDAHILAAVADESRPEADRARDANRKPAEMLAFAGIEPGWRVADITAGAGYFTRILSGAVGPSGQVYAHNPDWVAQRFPDGDAALAAYVAETANATHIVAPSPDFAAGIDQPLDAVLIVQFYHDMAWDGTDRAGFVRAVYDALRPGGVFLVVDHRAEDGSGLRDVQTIHRIDEATVREEIEAGGFVLEAETDLLANPDDPRTESVFGSLRGRTDQFVHRYRRPD